MSGGRRDCLFSSVCVAVAVCRSSRPTPKRKPTPTPTPKRKNQIANNSDDNNTAVYSPGIYRIVPCRTVIYRVASYCVVLHRTVPIAQCRDKDSWFVRLLFFFSSVARQLFVFVVVQASGFVLLYAPCSVVLGFRMIAFTFSLVVARINCTAQAATALSVSGAPVQTLRQIAVASRAQNKAAPEKKTFDQETQGRSRHKPQNRPSTESTFDSFTVCPKPIQPDDASAPTTAAARLPQAAPRLFP